MICQTTDPTRMLETLASLICKDGGDLSDILAFVPTRRAARALERILCERAGGAAMLPKIVPLGEGDDSEEPIDVVSAAERKIILSKLLAAAAGAVGVPGGFAGALAVAGELLTLRDYLENEGIDIRDIDWRDLMPDGRKAKFLDAIKDIDPGPTAAAVRNRGIAAWQNRLGDYRAVFCAGSTASVKSTHGLMAAIAGLPNGCVVFPGMVRDLSDIGRADPYWSIKKFLRQTGLPIETIDVGGAEKIAFMNDCFDNAFAGKKLKAPGNIRRIDCDTESEEAAVAAALSARARREKKSVLIITPDSAGEQRIKAALAEYGLWVDSSAGTPLCATPVGRFALRLFDYMCGTENKDVIAADLSRDRKVLDGLAWNGNLSDFITGAMKRLDYWIAADAAADLFFTRVAELSDVLARYDLDANAAALMLTETLKAESVRPPMSGDYDVKILGTAESRMQTADAVIITGLSDGMFPSNGFEHDWLPRNIAHKIGLPSSDSKVSLMALDFMTLSCGREVYWTRSKMAGGSESVPSRFLSRVGVAAEIETGADILAAVRARDMVPLCPLDRTPPRVGYAGDYYATWLESLVHNPYLFYARHILRLRRRPDVGDEVGAREFGTLVHGVIERCARAGIADAEKIVALMTDAALKYVDGKSVLFRFWRNRFREMAPEIAKMLAAPAAIEETIRMTWNGRNLIAKADRIEGGNKVIDYKTGSVPSDAQLGLGKEEDCTMPQLPVEAMILRDSHSGAPASETPVSMAFLSLKKNNVGMRDYDAEETARAIKAVEKKLNFILNKDVYARPAHYLDEKYREFDDLGRADD